MSFLEHNLNLFLDKPDILFLTETWLDQSVLNAELNLKEYFIYRTDRSLPKCANEDCPSMTAEVDDVDVEEECTCLTKRGGGVLIAVKNNLNLQL